MFSLWIQRPDNALYNSFAKPYILQDDGQYGRQMQPRIVNGYIISENLCLLLKESQRASHSKRCLQYHCEWLVARDNIRSRKI